MLHISSLNTHYGQAHILRDVSLHIEAGEIVALLGRNGAGKSTLMKAIIGTVPASSGVITYCGQNLDKLKNYERTRLGIGYVPEERRIFRNLTVLENITSGCRPPHPGKEPWTLERIFALFPKLDELKDLLGGQISGGEQQMLTIARTLMTNPDFLLLDEPTEGLAPVIVEQVKSAIQTLRKDGVAILISEQNRHTAAALADRVYILEKGQIIHDGALNNMGPRARSALGW